MYKSHGIARGCLSATSPTKKPGRQELYFRNSCSGSTGRWPRNQTLKILVMRNYSLTMLRYIQQLQPSLETNSHTRKSVSFQKKLTSKTQPVDTRIFQALKLSYRKKSYTRIMQRLKDDMEADQYEGLNIALVICWIVKCWNKMNSRTISRCFEKCGFRH